MLSFQDASALSITGLAKVFFVHVAQQGDLIDEAAVASWNLCNVVGFVKLFWTSVMRQVSCKVEPLSLQR